MHIQLVDGDLLAQPVEAIVNPWNQNRIPWWLLMPHGVSGAIKKRGGLGVFRELGRQGHIPLGQAVYTSAGKLPFRAIIHVASIDLRWRTSATTIRECSSNAIALAQRLAVSSVAFPLIGSGSAGFDAQQAEQIMREALEAMTADLRVVLVRYAVLSHL